MSPSETERVLVFAYGSNMCLPHLREWACAKGLPDVRILDATRASLPNFRLAWNYRSRRRSGAANVVCDPDAIVHGVLLATDPIGLTTLDQKEGTPIYYDRALQTVEVGGAAMSAWVYQVTEQYQVPPPVWPLRSYLELLLAGARAHGLPEDYVSALASLPVIEAA